MEGGRRREHRHLCMSHSVTAHWWIKVCFRMLPLFTCFFSFLERRSLAHPCSQIALHSSPQCRTWMLDDRKPMLPRTHLSSRLSCCLMPFNTYSISCCVTINHVWNHGEWQHLGGASQPLEKALLGRAASTCLDAPISR